MHSDIHAEHRVNRDHPAYDHRDGKPKPLKASEPCDACRGHHASLWT